MTEGTRIFVVQASLPPVVYPKDFDGQEPPVNEYDTLMMPSRLQKAVIEARDRYIERHPRVYPNTVILQDSVIVSAQLPREVMKQRPENRPEAVKDRIKELYQKLEEWQGRVLFKWLRLNFYNRPNVIGNRDTPFIFLETREVKT